ncbi:MAG: FecR domain-containing protein [Chloroflexi bacterium]|nr:FecR domain-containing protein [Chloroflexota bacterium]
MNRRNANRRLAGILDECLELIGSGERLESCLANYADFKEELEALLATAVSLRSLPKVSLSTESRRISEARLMSRLRFEAQDKATKAWKHLVLGELVLVGERLCRGFVASRKATIAVLGCVLALLIVAATIQPFPSSSMKQALATQSTLTILSGSVEVKVSGSEIWQAGTSGMVLSAGDRARTASDSSALLTFFEGSTIELEPDTDIEIERATSDDGQSRTIVLKQWMGRTWSRVVKMIDAGSRYQIDTPSATAIVRGTLFTTEVGENGDTKVVTTEGLVSVVAQDKEIYLPRGQETHVEAGMAPSQPVMLPEATEEMVVIVSGSVVGSVTDPTGASTGRLPNGLDFNQIAGSRLSSIVDGNWFISIPHPVSGEYVLTMRYPTPGTARFQILGKSDNKAVFQYAGEYEDNGENGWVVRINVRMSNGRIIGGEMNTVEPLGERVPERVVPAKQSKEDSGQSGNKGTIVNKGNEPDKGQPGDKGTPGDKGKELDKGQPSDRGTPDDKGKEPGKGQPVDKSSPDDKNKEPDKDKPDDRGSPDDKGKGADTGQPSDKGSPDDKGKELDKGQPVDKGSPDDKGKEQDTGQPSDKGSPDDKGKEPDKGKGGDKDADRPKPKDVSSKP